MHTFYSHYAEEWRHLIRKNKILNATEACHYFEITENELASKWRSCAVRGRELCVADNIWVCLIDNVPHKPSRYVINGQFLSSKNELLAPASSIYYFVLAWDIDVMTYQSFLNDVLGSESFSNARPMSIRGMLYRNWKQMGLRRAPSSGESCIYASCSAFESLVDRINWLDQDINLDIMGTAMMEMGISLDVITACKIDPVVNGRSLLSHLKACDAEMCISVMLTLFIEGIYFFGV